LGTTTARTRDDRGVDVDHDRVGPDALGGLGEHARARFQHRGQHLAGLDRDDRAFRPGEARHLDEAKQPWAGVVGHRSPTVDEVHLVRLGEAVRNRAHPDEVADSLEILGVTGHSHRDASGCSTLLMGTSRRRALDVIAAPGNNSRPAEWPRAGRPAERR
jgi:hypothetical protein